VGKRACSKALPDVAGRSRQTWAKLKVHWRRPTFNSTGTIIRRPFRLVGAELWFEKRPNRLVDAVSRARIGLRLIPRRRRGKGPSAQPWTTTCPPQAQAWQQQKYQVVLAQRSRKIGPRPAYAVVHCHVRGEPRLDQDACRARRACGSKQNYGTIPGARSGWRAACSRANHYGTPGYKVIKTILEKGLESTSPA